jgi:D-beta-D-heptose 7-phosphate kinase / D-beta-D-heptose 1-phosphate adenosyltransferase
MMKFQDKVPKILVIGDLMIDYYLMGSSDRISPESPVPIIDVNDESSLLGGAGNVINNLKALGSEIDIISVLGDCNNSRELMNLLEEINISTKYIIFQEGRIASKKTRIIVSKQQVVRYDRESTNEISSESQTTVIDIFNKIISSYDLVILSDYGKGVLTTELTQSLISVAKKYEKKVLVDPKGKDYSKYKGAYLLTPNKKEASEASNISIIDDDSLSIAITKLKSKFNLEVSIITLSEGGVAVFDNQFRIHPTIAREIFDVTGAGDTIIASLGFALACDIYIDDAIKFANLAAAVVVGKIGSASATLNEINEYESSINKSSSKEHIKTLTEITFLTKDLKAKGKKIVFTNGCFDLIHMGHISYLESSKEFGDILIVGLNSDKSVTSLKGKNRPFNIQSDRAYILAALEVVDYVVIFDEDTPYNLINAIQPHVLVKGGDYDGKKVVGQDIADELKLIKFIPNKSSSLTIEKIQKGK